MGYEERKSQTTVQSTTKKPTISLEHRTGESIIVISEKCGMLPSTIQTGQVKINILVNGDLKHSKKQKNMNDNSLTSRILPVIFCSSVFQKTTWKTCSTD